MRLHLAEVAQAVAPGAHGVMLMDRAGWHRAKDLVVPDNLTLVLLPARAPELNPVENIWQTVCSLLQRRWLVPRYAANEGCAGWSGTEPHALTPTVTNFRRYLTVVRRSAPAFD